MICCTPCIANCSSPTSVGWIFTQKGTYHSCSCRALSVCLEPSTLFNRLQIPTQSTKELWLKTGASPKDCRVGPLCMCSSLYLQKTQDAEDVPFYRQGNTANSYFLQYKAYKLIQNALRIRKCELVPLNIQIMQIFMKMFRETFWLQEVTKGLCL